MSFSGNQYPNNAAKVITTRGDIVRGNSSGERSRYGIGAANTVLTSDGTDPSWAAHGGVPTTTKGDISGFSTTQARIPISTNNYSLLADSAQALGLKWAASATSVLSTAGDILAASSANVLSRIQPAASGTILTSNGAGVAATFQAAAGGGAWSELYNSGVTTSTGVLDTGTMDAKTMLHFMIHTANVSSGNLAVRFNGTSSSQYSWSGFYNNAGSSTTSADREAIQFLIAGSSGTYFCGVDGYIFNIAGENKLVIMTTVENKDAGASNTPLNSYWVGEWANGTNQVTRIEVCGDDGVANDQKADSQLVVWGAGD